MTWAYTEFVLVSLAAMLAPTTLMFSVLALVLSDRPLRTGFWFMLGPFTTTIAVGIAAAFVVGDTAASSDSTPKTWVAIIDVVAAALLLAWVVRLMQRPQNPEQTKAAIARMGRVASAPAVAIAGWGVLLANPIFFVPLALKTISETDPTAQAYAVEWLFFTIVALLPLMVALVLLVVATDWTKRMLNAVRSWLERDARRVLAVIVVLLALVLLRNGIAGLTS